MTDACPSPSLKPSKPKIPFKLRLYMSLISAVTDACRRSNGTINRRLLSFLDVCVAANPSPVDSVRTVDLTVDPNRNLWIRLFLPTSPPPQDRGLPLVVFFHGGGFAFLSPSSRTYDLVCRRIARSIPVVVASVHYRHSPEHRFPAQYDDGTDVLRFIDSGAIDGTANIDPSACFLVGDSAGANIIHHVGRRWAADCEGWKKLKISGMVLIQPFFGGVERTESEIRLEGAPLVSMERTDWLWRAFLPEGEDRDHEAVNVFGPRDRGEIEKDFPSVMVVVGGHDPLQDWQRRYYEGLRARGREVTLVEFPDAVHAFFVFPEFADGESLIEEMRKFINSHRPNTGGGPEV
ncbi:hypothetical protein HPP92_024085 [Vanilla planifolia]|uniref:Alpha/beta hydrolase fold-3 domain-containing protein n=1 Tax=Vanilla planifolia TaxID=51239 RepID=A0A835PUF9_VANPL|nr:hypothetical protein HPP92_024085 [Vanilla planifolia]